MAEWGEVMEGGSETPQHFIMVFSPTQQIQNIFQLRLLLWKRLWGKNHGGDPENGQWSAPGAVSEIETPVDLVYFQGPHFGDRYGIAAAAFGALETQGIQLLAAGCTGASIYIVVPDKRAQAVIRCLSEPFGYLKQPLDEFL